MKKAITGTVLAAMVVFTASQAHAWVVCAEDDGTGQPKPKSKLSLETACTPGNQVEIGVAYNTSIGTVECSSHHCSCTADDLFLIVGDLPSRTAGSTGHLRYEQCSEAPHRGQLYALTFNNTVRGVIQVTSVHPHTFRYTVMMDLADTDWI